MVMGARPTTAMDGVRMVEQPVATNGLSVQTSSTLSNTAASVGSQPTQVTRALCLGQVMLCPDLLRIL